MHRGVIGTLDEEKRDRQCWAIGAVCTQKSSVICCRAEKHIFFVFKQTLPKNVTEPSQRDKADFGENVVRTSSTFSSDSIALLIQWASFGEDNLIGSGMGACQAGVHNTRRIMRPLVERCKTPFVN